MAGMTVTRIAKRTDPSKNNQNRLTKINNLL